MQGKRKQRRQAASKAVQSFFGSSSSSVVSSTSSSSSSKKLTPSGRVSIAQPKPELKVPAGAFGPLGDDQLGPEDVLCGRGALLMSHPGNRRFRSLIRQHRGRYLSADTPKLQKAFVAMQVVDTIRASGGRFLAKSSRDGSWYDVGDQKALKKAGQAMRDNDDEEDNKDTQAVKSKKTKKPKKPKSKRNKVGESEDDDDEWVPSSEEMTAMVSVSDHHRVQHYHHQEIQGQDIIDFMDVDMIDISTTNNDDWNAACPSPPPSMISTTSSSASSWATTQQQYEHQDPPTIRSIKLEAPAPPAKPSSSFRWPTLTTSTIEEPTEPSWPTSVTPPPSSEATHRALRAPPTQRDDQAFGLPFTHPPSLCGSSKCSGLSSSAMSTI